MSDLMLDVGQANELKLAFRRHDFTSEEVKRLTEGDFLGLVRGVLRGTRRIVEVELTYPDWVREHLTPELEVKRPEDPGEVELYLDPRQESNPYPTGDEVYEHLKEEDLLVPSLSYGHLVWLSEHPEHIPAEWRGKMVYAWASVVRLSDGSLFVPYLYCHVASPCVLWHWLDYGWDGLEPAGLRK